MTLFCRQSIKGNDRNVPQRFVNHVEVKASRCWPQAPHVFSALLARVARSSQMWQRRPAEGLWLIAQRHCLFVFTFSHMPMLGLSLLPQPFLILKTTNHKKITSFTTLKTVCCRPPLIQIYCFISPVNTGTSHHLSTWAAHRIHMFLNVLKYLKPE